MNGWERYTLGPAHLTFYARDGAPFTGEFSDWWRIHKSVSGLVKKTTGALVLLNERNEIAAVGRVIGENK